MRTLNKKTTLTIIILLTLITLLGAFLRFYKVLEVPIQLNHDEISQLYDAISIAETGKDIYQNPYPFIFTSINDYKPPYYTYATAFFYFLFGKGEVIIKLPGVIFGTLVILAVYFFASVYFKSKKISLIASFVTAISPFEIYYSRKGFESGTGIFFILTGFSLLYLYILKKQARFLLLGSLILAGSMYTYFSHATTIPLLLIAFTVIFRKSIKEDFKFKNSLRNYSIALIIFLIITTPLFWLIKTNPDLTNRSKAVFITQDVNLSSLLNKITSDNSIGNQLLRNLTTIDYSFTRFLSQFSPDFIFGFGLGLTNYQIIGMGLLYFIQIPFLIFGFIYLLKKEDLKKTSYFVLFWILIGMVASGLTFEPFSPHRSIMVFTMFNIISSLGIYYFALIMLSIYKSNQNIFLSILEVNSRITSKINRLVVFGICSIVIIIFVYNAAFFYQLYTYNYWYERSEDLHYPFAQVGKYIKEEHNNYQQVIFDPKFGKIMPSVGASSQYYLAYYSDYQPFKLQQEYRIGEKPREILFSNYSIREVTWLEDSKLKNVLIIASPLVLPENIKDNANIVKVFNFYDGSAAFYAIKL